MPARKVVPSAGPPKFYRDTPLVASRTVGRAAAVRMVAVVEVIAVATAAAASTAATTVRSMPLEGIMRVGSEAAA